MAKRGFDIRKLTGFSSIAMACFFMLYMPIVLLVVLLLTASGTFFETRLFLGWFGPG